MKHGADVGIALDGDADRVIMADERGRVVDGDDMLAVLARHLSDMGRLAHQTVVATVMTNLGIERFLTERDITLERANVGDRYVVGRMRAGGFNLGGEQSGHLILLNHTTTGDGLLTALQMMAVLVERGVPLSELTKGLVRVPQVLKAVKVKDKPPLSSLPPVAAAIGAGEQMLSGRGRVLVRYSGTEAKCRVMVEGDDSAEIEGIADSIVAAVSDTIGLESSMV